MVFRRHLYKTMVLRNAPVSVPCNGVAITSAVATVRVYIITGQPIFLSSLILCLSLVPIGTNIVR